MPNGNGLLNAPQDIQIIACRFGSKANFPMETPIVTNDLWAGGLVTGNFFGCEKANALDGNRAAIEAQGVYLAGNEYTDGQDPRL